MAFESPLFQSSMELLGHSIEHFVALDELDRKLVILHLANAVELIFKDIMLDGGVSIYKSPKETVTIYGAIEELKKLSVPIPCANKIDLLIDERNALQHRYGSPNELTTIYYMNMAIEFFDSVLTNQYSLKLDEVLIQFTNKAAWLAFKLRQPTNDTELEKLNSLAAVHPLGAFLSAYAYFERVSEEFMSRVVWPDEATRRRFSMNPPFRAAERLGLVMPHDLRRSLEEVRQTRNLAAHGRGDVTKEDVKNAIQAIEQFEKLAKDHQPIVPDPQVNITFTPGDTVAG